MTDRVTVETLRSRKRSREPIAGLTAYDYSTAVFIDRAGLDLVLVGDSLGTLVLGRPRPEETTMDDMIHHCSAVTRGVARAMVIGDMPFGSFEVSPTLAVENAIRLVKEGGVSAVKLEGGIDVVPAVRAIADARIPVIGHLALLHGESRGSRGDLTDGLLRAARALEDAGAAAVVLVGLTPKVAQSISESLQTIPSIGYRSGPSCDGQLLVTPLMLGLVPTENLEPGPYGALGQLLLETFSRFREDVITRNVNSM